MNEKEFNGVIKAPMQKKYKYFLNKAADNGSIWGLYKDGWAMSSDDKDSLFIPLWPLKEFALAAAIEEWGDYKPEKLDIGEFLEKYLDEITDNGIGVSVMYTKENKGIIVNNKQLKKDLQRELHRIE